MKTLTSGNRIRKSKRNQVAEQDRSTNPRIGQLARHILEIEALETRLLLSGVGTGLNKKKVTFTDADGDKVTVTLAGAAKGDHPSFNITLDGAATNNADIQSIVINGSDTNTALSIVVASNKLKLPNTIPDMHTGKPYTFTPGFTEVSLISSNTSLKGISATSAALDNVVIGDSNSANGTPNLGSIAITIGKSQFFGLVGTSGDDPLSKIDLGNVSVEGHIGSIVMHGRADLTNNLNGTITAGAGIDMINAPFSDVLAPITVTGSPTTGANAGIAIGQLSVHDIVSNVSAVGNVGTVQAHNLLGSVIASGSVNSLSLTGSLIGVAKAGTTFGALSVNGVFTGLLEAGSIGDIVINASGAAGFLNINGEVIDSTLGFTGTIHATAGNIGNIIVSQSTTGFSGHVLADNGNIGNLTAGFFYQASVEASGSIGQITSNITSAGIDSIQHNFNSNVDAGIDESTFVAHNGGIGGVAAAYAIDDSIFTATGAIGNVKTLEGSITGSGFSGGSIGNVSSLGGYIQNTSLVATTTIGNIYSADVISRVSAIAGGNIGNITAKNLLGRLSTASIDQSVFTSTGGSIGNVTALQNATGNLDGVEGSIFTAYSAIGAVNAVSNTPSSGIGISNSTFTVTGHNLTGLVFGDVTASGTGGGIANTTFHAVSGDIGNISGSSILGAGLLNTHIAAYNGSVGNIRGLSLGGNNNQGGNGLDHVRIYATGKIGTVYGKASYGFNGLSFVTITGGAAGGTIGDITGTGTNACGIDHMYVNTPGSIGNITGTSVHQSGICYSTFYAGGSIGNVTGTTTGGDSFSGIRSSTFHADFGKTGTGSIGNVTGTTVGNHGTGSPYIPGKAAYTSKVPIDGGGYTYTFHPAVPPIAATPGSQGIDRSTFIASSGIGAITGAAKSAYSGHGIYGTYVNADAMKLGKGGIVSITGTTVGKNASGIYGSTFYAGAGIGNIDGEATGVKSGSGIANSTFDADITRSGAVVASIGNITGVSLNKAAGGSTHGIDNSFFYSGYSIGTVTGMTTAVGNASGINNSMFFANAGKAATAGGKGVIGTVTGTSNGLGYGPHYGINDSYFGAGNGVGGNGTIGNVSGVATAKSANNNTSAYGIMNTSIMAGIDAAGTGVIGTVDGNATANASVSGNATAGGIAGHTFIKAGGLSGTIGAVSGEGVATSATGTATAYGIQGVGGVGYAAQLKITAGSAVNGTGTIASITGTATATGVTATADGIYYAYVRAGNGVGGTGTVTGGITGVATANSTTGTASAYGIYSSYAYIGHKLGTVANVTGTGTATSTGGNAVGYGIDFLSLYVGYGHGKVNGSGTLTAISGTATATAAGNATAIGIDDAFAHVGWHNGVITSVSGKATATTYGSVAATSATANATGLNHSTFNTGYGYGSGSIGDVTGSAYAYGSGGGTDKGTTITANATGINTTNLFAAAHSIGATTAGDFGTGSIGNVTGTAVAKVTSGYTSVATAKGINSLTAIASDGDYGTGTIGVVSGSGTASATSENSATASAYGITGVGSILAGSGFHGTGTITTVNGDASATALTHGDNNDLASAKAIGLGGETIGVGTGSYGIGTIGTISDTVSAVANGGSTAVYASGFGAGLTITVGGNQSAVGHTPFLHQHVYVKAISQYGDATATAIGLNGITINVGTGNYGVGFVGNSTDGSIYAYAKAVAKAFHGNATANAVGITGVTINAGTGYKGQGTIYGITGIGIADAYAYGLKGNATANAAGITGFSSFHAGDSAPVVGSVNPKSFGGTGVIGATGAIGNITGTGTAVATTYNSTTKSSPDEGKAYANAWGIQNTEAYAGNATAILVAPVKGASAIAYGGTGSIGNFNGTANASATAKGFQGVAGSNAWGIVDSGAQAGDATVSGGNGVARVLGSGSIGTITGTAIAKSVGSGGTNVNPTFANAYGIEATHKGGVVFSAGDAVSSGTAYGGQGSIGAIKGSASALATASAKYSNASTKAYGIDGSEGVTFSAGNSTGVGTASGAVAAKSTIGTITGTGDTGDAAYFAQGTSASATGVGIRNVTANAGNATSTGGAATAVYGNIGALAGTGLATATGDTTVASSTGAATAIGVKATNAIYALNAANAIGATTATAGTGIVGGITGQATVNVTGSTVTTAKAWGIDPFNVNAATANGTKSAVGGTGTIGDLSGTASVTASGAVAQGASYGIVGGTLTAGSATSGLATGYSATAGAGTIAKAAGVVGKATTIVTATKDAGNTYSRAYGISGLNLVASTASGYLATGAAGEIATAGISGTAQATITGTSVGSTGAKAIGVNALNANAGSATGLTGDASTKSVAQAGTGTIAATGGVVGNATALVNPSTTSGLGGSSIYGVAYGAQTVALRAGYASAFTATAAQGTLGGVSGTGSAIVSGTTVGTGANVTATAHGASGATLDGGQAVGNSTVGLGGSATGATGSIGNLYGKATANVTGTTAAGSVTSTAIGLDPITATAASAAGYNAAFAAGATGTIGDIKGLAYATVNPSSISGITAAGISGTATGITGVTATAGKAVGYLGAGTGKGSATGVSGSVAATNGIYGKALTYVTGTTGSKSTGNVNGNGVGITGVNITAGFASGYKAAFAAGSTGTVGNIKGVVNPGAKAIVTSSGAGGSVGSTFGFGISGLNVTTGVAYGNQASKKGAGTGVAGTIGDVTGTVNTTISQTGNAARVGTDAEVGLLGVNLKAGNARGYTVSAGKSSIAVTNGITGSATTSVTGVTTGKSAPVYSSRVYGIDALVIYAGNANAGGTGGLQSATGADVSIGAINGSASATVNGTTGDTGSAVTADSNRGILGLGVTASYATGYTATAGNATLGNIKGSAAGSATAATKTIDGFARSITNYGVQNLNLNTSNAVGSLAKGAGAGGVGNAGISEIGNIGGYATAFAKNTTTYTKAALVGATTARAVGINGLLGNVSSATGYTAKGATGFSVGTINGGSVTAPVKATAIGSGGVQTANSAAYGVQASLLNVSILNPAGGKNTTAGTGTIGATSGVAGAYSTAYFTNATSKGIDPVTFTTGSGVTTGAIYGKAVAAATGYGDDTSKVAPVPTSATAHATGVEALTVNAANYAKAAASIGNVSGYGKASALLPNSAKSVSTTAVGVGQTGTRLYAGIGATTGNIGNLSGTGYGYDKIGTKAGTNSTGFGIQGARVYGATSIGSISGYANKATGFSYGIGSSVFVANGAGGIGNISAGAAAKSTKAGPYTLAINGSDFSTGGSIGAGKGTAVYAKQGDISGSRFLAGFSLGANLALDGLDTATKGQSIGAVSVQGRFLSSDLIASINPTGLAWGGADTPAANGGSIGSIDIGFPAPALLGGAVGHAIEAATLNAHILWGGTDIKALAPVVVNGGDGVGILVRTL